MAHLFIGMEALTTLARERELRRRSISAEELADQWASPIRRAASPGTVSILKSGGAFCSPAIVRPRMRLNRPVELPRVRWKLWLLSLKTF
jgi:hypothetical protein